ncbi:MAG: DUF4384 domain-containing protein [Nitrospirae bacterium]|nr:DUF4384 domain-containing protein [Nitrospirota bacterium]
MMRIFASLLISLFLFSSLYAAQSVIIEVEGNACMGRKKSSKLTKREALADAKKKAVEQAASYISEGLKIKYLDYKKDITGAFSHSDVNVLGSKEIGWYKEGRSGKCFKVLMKAEVIPDMRAMMNIGRDRLFAEDPSAPLQVEAWTDKHDYKSGEKIKVFFKGNKPFYARIHYRDVKGGLVQLLTNPFRENNYFSGAVVYEIPSGSDSYQIEITPPLGEENIIVYASTFPLGEIDVTARGAFYLIKTKPYEIGTKTRGVKLKTMSGGDGVSAAEFFEDRVAVTTRQ